MTTPSRVIQESERREASLREAITELEEFKTRYVGLVEMAPVFNALATLKLKRPIVQKISFRFMPISSH